MFVTESLPEECLSHGIVWYTEEYPVLSQPFLRPPWLMSQVLVVWSDRNATISRVSKLDSTLQLLLGEVPCVFVFFHSWSGPGLLFKSSNRRRARAASPLWLKGLRLSCSRFSFFPFGFLFSWTTILSSPGFRGRIE